MKKLILSIIAAITCIGSMSAQEADAGKIVVVPYVVNATNTAYPKSSKILTDKLNRIVLKSGMVSTGASSPFVITANPVINEEETTPTAPPKTVINMTLTVYVGNGEDGTLFASWSTDLKGIGDSRDQAFASAYRKLKVDDPALLNAMAEAQNKVREYYDSKAPDIIREAERLVASGDYEAACERLMGVPYVSAHYHTAQGLIAKYMGQKLDMDNNSVLAQARAAWSANPNEQGASQAQDILAGISYPSPAIAKEATSLMREMATRLQKAEDDRLKAMEAAAQREHQQQIELTRAAAKVAAARESRPVYYNVHYHSWWW